MSSLAHTSAEMTDANNEMRAFYKWVKPLSQITLKNCYFDFFLTIKRLSGLWFWCLWAPAGPPQPYPWYSASPMLLIGGPGLCRQALLFFFFSSHIRICSLIWERNINWLPPICAPTKDWTCNLGMCSDWELNPQLFGIQDVAPTNWATWARAAYSSKYGKELHLSKKGVKGRLAPEALPVFFNEW